MEETATDDLLTAPTASSEKFSKRFKRKSCRYEDKCERFRVADRDYTRQYAHIYFTRLKKLKKGVEKAAERKWGKYREDKGCVDGADCQFESTRELISISQARPTCFSWVRK